MSETKTSSPMSLAVLADVHSNRWAVEAVLQDIDRRQLMECHWRWTSFESASNHPSTLLLWVTSCEDGNPRFVTLGPTSGTITPYTLPTTPHGGGYDDLAFVNGMAFIAASNPNLMQQVSMSSRRSTR